MRTMFSVVLSVLSSAFLLACADDGLGDHGGGSALVADVDAGGSTTDSNADIGTDTGSPGTHECDHESGDDKGFGTSPSRGLDKGIGTSPSGPLNGIGTSPSRP